MTHGFPVIQLPMDFVSGTPCDQEQYIHGTHNLLAQLIGLDPFIPLERLVASQLCLPDRKKRKFSISRVSLQLEGAAVFSASLWLMRDSSMGESALDPFIAAELFDLMPAEADACVALAAGMTPEEICKGKRRVDKHSSDAVEGHLCLGRDQRQADLMLILDNLGSFEPLGSLEKRLGER